MLFIDQPIGTGFSYTNDCDGPVCNLKAGTTALAAADFWKMLQIFFADPKFNAYKDKPLGLFTESYGGHYGPSFAAYFLSQNQKIRAGELEGILINFRTLGVGNGITDAVHQFESYMEYAIENPYRVLAQSGLLQVAKEIFHNDPITCATKNELCKVLPPSCRLLGLDPDRLAPCPGSESGSSIPDPRKIFKKLRVGPDTGCNSRMLFCQIAALLSAIRLPDALNSFHSMCSNAHGFCTESYWGPLSNIEGNPYYVIDPNDKHRLPNIEGLLSDNATLDKIGAKSHFVISSEDVFNNFWETGDFMYSFVENLETVIDAGVSTLIYDGDADFVVNYHGAEKLVDYLNIESKNRIGTLPKVNYTVNGEVAGSFKTSGTFSYLNVNVDLEGRN